MIMLTALSSPAVPGSGLEIVDQFVKVRSSSSDHLRGLRLSAEDFAKLYYIPPPITFYCDQSASFVLRFKMSVSSVPSKDQGLFLQQEVPNTIDAMLCYC
jgi:hypothetical protein